LDQGLIEFGQEVLLGGGKMLIRADLDDQLNHIIPPLHFAGTVTGRETSQHHPLAEGSL